MMLASVTKMKTPQKGDGVFATEAIPKGTIVWTPCSQCHCASPQDLAQMSRENRDQLEYRGFYLSDGHLWASCGVTPLMNHACHASLLDFGLDFCIAVRDIAPGEELTQDYRTFGQDPEGSWHFECQCGASDCVKLVEPRAVLDASLLDLWRERVVGALERIKSVPQPLAEVARRESRAYAYILQEGCEQLFDQGFAITAPFMAQRTFA